MRTDPSVYLISLGRQPAKRDGLWRTSRPGSLKKTDEYLVQLRGNEFMINEARVLALSVKANIYVVVDEKGNSLGTGTREVCEVLARIATKEVTPGVKPYHFRARPSVGNIRSAITI